MERNQLFKDGVYDSHFENNHKNRFDWLEELTGFAASEDTPLSLNDLTIEERIKHPKGFSFDRHVWQPPSHLRETLVREAIDLQVWLRKPMGSQW